MERVVDAVSVADGRQVGTVTIDREAFGGAAMAALDIAEADPLARAEAHPRRRDKTDGFTMDADRS